MSTADEANPHARATEVGVTIGISRAHFLGQQRQRFARERGQKSLHTERATSFAGSNATFIRPGKEKLSQ